MTKRIKQFVFVLALFVVCLPSKWGVLDAYIIEENLCTCDVYDYDYVYLYRYNEEINQYWFFIDQGEPYYTNVFYPSGFPGAAFCVSDCRYFARLHARFLCDSYSYPQQHYQYQFWWHFEDANNDSGGSQTGFVDTGAQLLMCDDLH